MFKTRFKYTYTYLENFAQLFCLFGHSVDPSGFYNAVNLMHCFYFGSLYLYV